MKQYDETEHRDEAEPEQDPENRSRFADIIGSFPTFIPFPSLRERLNRTNGKSDDDAQPADENSRNPTVELGDESNGNEPPATRDIDQSDTTTNEQTDKPGMAPRVDSFHATIRNVLTKLVPAGHAIRLAWSKRPKLSFALYAIVFVIVDAFCVLALQWSVYSETEYAPDAQVDETTRIMGTIAGQLTRFVSQMWLEHQWQFLLNFLVLGLLYLVVITLFNRFWVATALFGTVMTVFAVANRCKVELRNEPIIPADLNFVTGGNTDELISFVPAEDMAMISDAVRLLVGFVLVCVLLQFLDRRNGLIPCHWRPSKFVGVSNITAVVTRVLAFVVTASLAAGFIWNLGVPNSWAQRFSQRLSDAPELWNSMGDATNNGPAMNFLRLVHAETMDEPEDYNEETMRGILEKYQDEADAINASRSDELTDHTVIMILSESFSDPTRVPGISFSEDPMPNIHAIKAGTTSGLMLSPGYGGGTANIEFQALTGFSMGLYDPSLSSAYQQLVPNMDAPESFNQIWNEADSDDGSVAFHPFNRNMYFRDRNYDAFGFSHFYASDGNERMTDITPLESAWYASDESTYRNVLDYLDDEDGSHGSQFIQVVTMQNHMPYDDWYQDNQFVAADMSPGLADDERVQIDTYAKGVSYTDQATADFLAQLDQMDRPITVLFYGDHLPGIYNTAASDPTNNLALHETDYFIWSNAASGVQGVKLPDSSAAYTSSNYFMAQIAEQTNSKVSPYLAFLTRMHETIPAIAPTSSGMAGNGSLPTMLDAMGNQITESGITDQMAAMLHDYELIQYDMSVGKGYLLDSGFTEVNQSR